MPQDPVCDFSAALEHMAMALWLGRDHVRKVPVSLYWHFCVPRHPGSLLHGYLFFRIFPQWPGVAVSLSFLPQLCVPAASVAFCPAALDWLWSFPQGLCTTLHLVVSAFLWFHGRDQ